MHGELYGTTKEIEIKQEKKHLLFWSSRGHAKSCTQTTALIRHQRNTSFKQVPHLSSPLPPTLHLPFTLD